MRGERGETHIMQDIRARLGLRRDFKIIRINSGVFGAGSRKVRTVSVNGFPDTFGALRVLGVGVLVGIEAKRPGERQSPEQIIAQQVLEGLGCIYIVARSADEAELELERSRQRVIARMTAEVLAQ